MRTTTVDPRPLAAVPPVHDPMDSRGVRSRDVAELTAAAGYPSVSVLLPTSPGARLSAADVERLEELAREASRQLREQGVPSAERLMDRLAEQVAKVMAQPADRGLAIYVNLAVARTFRLPVPVHARAVVEQTFATRDLVHVLHRTPPHVVLSIGWGCAHVYQVHGETLRSVGHRDLFGRTATPADIGSEAVDAFLRDVDCMVASYRSEHPSPLVLAGSPAMVDRFVSLSQNIGRLAGRIMPDQAESPAELAAASEALLEEYLKSRRDDALETLASVLEGRPRDVARGMADSWHAVHRSRPQLLVVEEDYVSPARDGQVHDLVDDLMELVILRGGQMAVVGSGDLAEHGRVVLLSRPEGRP